MSLDIMPMFLLDAYKFDHRSQYPKGTTLVYSNFTPRRSRVANVDHMVFFGLQYLIKEYLIEQFNSLFFKQKKKHVMDEYRSMVDSVLGKDAISISHIGELHDLGYLPIIIKALPEGTPVPMGTPCLTLYNTHPEFFWVTNYLETLISSILWKPCTSATTAREFRINFEKYAKATGDPDFVPFQGHDFSYRGMSGLEDACMSSGAHLLYFKGTDTIPAIPWLEKYYGANRNLETIGCSVAATEHSVQSAGGYGNELETYKRLLTEVYPDGIVSIVSDTWDFWNVVTEYLPLLKDIIIARGRDSGKFSKLVIRPDSGVPHQIINGDPNSTLECERLGLVKCLDSIFGSSINSKGYQELNPSVGFIYGDSINLEEQVRILSGLKNNQYATTSGVLGIGSYTYQYVTRDTYGTVCKATYCEIDHKPREIFKSPKTGGWKKSHKGLLLVNSDLSVTQQVGWTQERGGLLKPVFYNGSLLTNVTLNQIRGWAELDILQNT